MRYAGVSITRIPAGGEYDEWIEVADAPSVGDFIEARKGGEDSIEVGLRLLSCMVKAWSLDLPISYDSIASLPFDLIRPAFEHVSKSFLEKPFTMNGSLPMLSGR